MLNLWNKLKSESFFVSTKMASNQHVIPNSFTNTQFYMILLSLPGAHDCSPFITFSVCKSEQFLYSYSAERLSCPISR